MGTRGYFAIVYKGKVYVSYCHFDAYPQNPGMGWKLVCEIHCGNMETWKQALDNIKVAKGTPTEEDKKALYPYTGLGVSDQSDYDWYCLTRHCQGSIAKTLQSGYFFGEVTPFKEKDIVTTLCSQEWGYMVDFDKNEFRTFSNREIHFWRFPLDGIPQGTFDEPSILAFNHIVDKSEWSCFDSSTEVVEAYKRFFEEEKFKEKEEKSKNDLKTDGGDAFADGTTE